MTKKSRQKFKYIENEKRFKLKQKAFFIIFKGLSLKQIKQVFLEGKSAILIYFIILNASFQAQIKSSLSRFPVLHRLT